MNRVSLYETSHVINENISIRVPRVRDVVDNEEEYFSNIAFLIATPYDLMVQLDDVHIDFTKISDWDLFCLMLNELKTRDLSLIFENLNLSEFELAENVLTNEMVLVNKLDGTIIDKEIHKAICDYLRNILQIKRVDKKPGNEEARKFMIERARVKLRRKKKTKDDSQIEKYIVSLVNTSEFPYNYETVLDITITQFYASLYQIIKKIKFDNTMIGCYAGTINMEELGQDELNWFTD